MMGYKTKRVMATSLVGIILTIVYVVFALGAKAPVATDISAWAVVILKFIGIGIGAIIVLQIAFHIAYSIGISVKEGIKKGIDGEGLEDKEVARLIKATFVEDEMDKVVETKASRFSSVCFGIGFIVALFVLANGLPILWALHIQLAAAMVGGLLEGVVSVFLYERGV